MKFLATILSFYFLGLVIIPCSDAETSTESEKEIAQVEHNPHQESSTDDCAPFCSCQCCQSQLTVIDFRVFEPLTPEIGQAFILFNDN
ncbi:MAG TPA: DUF6660 family protein, partial [Salinimicrobium sp.]|nr:DUF6660 family protein [Salinimicrobium sp.]